MDNREQPQINIEYYSCFISFSSKDYQFAERLYADLQQQGVRCWIATEDLKVGGNPWRQIDEAIQLYDKFLLIISENSIENTWIEKETEIALVKEVQSHEIVIIPIMIDDAIWQTT